MTEHEQALAELDLPFHERQRLLQEREQAKQAVERGRNLTDSEMQFWDSHFEQRMGEQYDFITELMIEMVVHMREEFADAIDSAMATLRAEINARVPEIEALRCEITKRAVLEDAGNVVELPNPLRAQHTSSDVA